MFNRIRASLWLRLQDVREREEGQGMVEYALILALVSVAAIVVLGFLGVDVDAALDTVETGIDGVAGG
jgi:Flp pilus assembly pilin Flp